jgi:hypothetical protein
MPSNPFVFNNPNVKPAERYRHIKAGARPSKSDPAFANLSPEALEIAQQWWDEGTVEMKQSEERSAQTAEYLANLPGGSLLSDIDTGDIDRAESFTSVRF